MNRTYAGAVAAVALAALLTGGTSFALAMQSNTAPPVDRASLRPDSETVKASGLPGGGWREVGAQAPASCTLPDPSGGGAMSSFVRRNGEVAHSWFSGTAYERRAQRWHDRTVESFRACAGPGATVQRRTPRIKGSATPITVVTATVPCRDGVPCAPHLAYAVGNWHSFLLAVELRTESPVPAEEVHSLIKTRFGSLFEDAE